MNYNKYEDFQIYISVPLIKHKLINLDRIVNNLIVHNLLINYLNLKSVQKQLLTVVLQSKAAVSRCSSIGVLKDIALFRGKRLFWSLLS